MLLEMYITLQILGIICFGIGFFRKSEWFWSFAIILFAVLIFASYNIEQNVSVVTNQSMTGNQIFYSYDIVSKHVVDKTYSYLNMGFFGLSLILFFFDLFINWKENKSVRR